MYVCVYVCRCVGTHVCMYIGACICIDLSMSFLSADICVHIFTYIYIYTSAHMIMHVYMLLCSPLSLSLSEPLGGVEGGEFFVADIPKSARHWLEEAMKKT